MANNEEVEEVLEPNAKNILLSIIGQLTKGADLQRVTLPTFVLEPRSFLERITDFMSHPEFIVQASRAQSTQDRFLKVVLYYLSGWHIKPKGVRKPYNPVLGEYFRCQWELKDGSKAYYLAEQTSHHPPVSAYVFASPENQFLIEGDMKPKSKFYGTSAGTVLEGSATIKLLNHPDEHYHITYPNIVAYGILFGKLTYDLGDIATIKCEASDLICKIEFKSKGIFSGSYHTLAGKIKKISTGQVLYDLSGKWNEKIFIKSHNVDTEDIFFDSNSVQIYPKVVAEEEKQDEYESRRLWQKVTENLVKNNMDMATTEKTMIEDRQREQTRQREATNEQWSYRFFKEVDDGHWRWTLSDLDSDPSVANQQIQKFIFDYQP